jgi:protochlorophyllide reductase
MDMQHILPSNVGGTTIISQTNLSSIYCSDLHSLHYNDIVFNSNSNSNFNLFSVSRIQSKIEKFTNRDMSEATDKKFGRSKICVITGTSSGLGRSTLNHLTKSKDEDYHVICAVRDPTKMEVVAEMDDIPKDKFTIIPYDGASFKSVHAFSESVKEFIEDRPLDRLVCNAAVYQPSLDYAKWSEDNIEQQTQINFLSHFLLISNLLPELRRAEKARVIMVGSVTGNDNTVGGGGVYPIADLHELEGFKLGGKKPVEMPDGRNFNGAKAYKDSKLMMMMLSNILHEKYHRATGISFSSIYPGCIAASPLFREKRQWFRRYFPVFMKYITGGFVSEFEAGQRLFQVITDKRCARSGVYWGWNGGPREGRDEALNTDGQITGAGGAGGGADSIFECDQSDKVRDLNMWAALWEYATKITGAEWMPARSAVSPCPTLRVIGLATKAIEAREDRINSQKLVTALAAEAELDNNARSFASSQPEKQSPTGNLLTTTFEDDVVDALCNSEGCVAF